MNSRDVGLARAGPRLYELLFRNYSVKQWERDPLDLDPSVLARIPVRSNFDDRYFTDKYQALPKKGYTHFAEGDVGLAKITPCFENGKSAIFRNLTGGIGAGTTELHIVRPLSVHQDYILLFLKSPHFIQTGIPKMTGTAGQKRVPTEYFAYSPFPLPPLAEQHRIVAKVDELMALCNRLEASLTTSNQTRTRLLEATLAEALAPASISEMEAAE
jgi:type I restriction enzyme S subunit